MTVCGSTANTRTKSTNNKRIRITQIRATITAQARTVIPLLPARRYASVGYSDRNVSVCLSVVRPSRAGIVSKRRKLAA